MNTIKLKIIICCFSAIIISSCKELINIDPPKTELVQSTVFSDDAGANAAINGVYAHMIADSHYFSTFGEGLICLPSLSADEYSLVYNITGFAENQIDPKSPNIALIWRSAYQSIYDTNSLLEGLATSSGISPGLIKQLQGEALFIRALHYFYLINLFGEVPLLLNTNYQKNAIAKKTAVAGIYKQITNDLIDAKNLLSLDYSAGGGKRVRANHWAARALLARVYLYTQKWELAEQEATAIIDQKTLYRLEPTLATVFLANNQEAILQFYPHPTRLNNPSEAFLANYNATLVPYTPLTIALYNAFENGDLRKTAWVGSRLTYHYPYKYKSRTTNAPAFTEYSTFLRLAEQYLIRAEARGHQNNITGALDDLEAVRKRTSLGRPVAADLITLMPLIEQERRIELFSEFGHRWLDLKRWNRADAVLGAKPTWKPEAVLYPLPFAEIQKNPNLN